ncbi:hypothetical protein [Endozoicomonas sp. SCSIO W0465]|uniref:hypothetical protein n=1 Tax=Endozoicomonas sp. SCSIO W0465 TaxID=2918516 RepID=UPI002074E13D|nr:hypothetical protein [Endozoicomonas sp. SCSIO W0465]USE34605.1 hypothetical protein MJO57_21020 [Endozoicomonas sp. SCSIO W0465]
MNIRKIKQALQLGRAMVLMPSAHLPDRLQVAKEMEEALAELDATTPFITSEQEQDHGKKTS